MSVVQDLVGRYAANTGAGTAPQGWSAPPVINPLVDVGQGPKVRGGWVERGGTEVSRMEGFVQR